MLFSSLIFLFYFLPVSLAGYFLMSFSRTLQNFWLLTVSLFFYAWGEPFFVFVMILSTLVNWLFGLFVEKTRKSPGSGKIVLFVMCLFNLGLLFVYKYLGFVVRNVNELAGTELIHFGGFALPVGISFFTFQAMSYVIDVYRKDAQAAKNPFNVGLYIAFFPQLIAGPIVRYADIADQIKNRRVTWGGFSYGVCRFISGLGKKILLANSMALVADHIFNISAMSGDITNVPVTLAWLGVFAYTLQIYHDFSGYSDMAIGLGQMFGFQFRENFNYPYISDSVVEFWRRWHISLSTWFREYVYFPLGGSRVANKDLMVRNTFIVWLLTGVWHGAEWTFVLWGLWHFMLIIAERALNFEERKIPAFFRHLYLLLAVSIGWMFFRAKDIYQALLYLRNLLGMNSNGFFSDMALMFVREYWFFFLWAVLFSAPIAPRLCETLRARTMRPLGNVLFALYPFAFMALFIICVTYLIKGSYNPFIYFNF